MRDLGGSRIRGRTVRIARYEVLAGGAGVDPETMAGGDGHATVRRGWGGWFAQTRPARDHEAVFADRQGFASPEDPEYGGGPDVRDALFALKSPDWGNPISGDSPAGEVWKRDFRSMCRAIGFTVDPACTRRGRRGA